MRGSGEQDKDVPDFMKTEHTRNKVKHFGTVDHRAKCVRHTADDEPDQHPGGEHRQQLSAGANA